MTEEERRAILEQEADKQFAAAQSAQIIIDADANGVEESYTGFEFGSEYTLTVKRFMRKCTNKDRFARKLDTRLRYGKTFVAFTDDGRIALIWNRQAHGVAITGLCKRSDWRQAIDTPLKHFGTFIDAYNNYLGFSKTDTEIDSWVRQKEFKVKVTVHTVWVKPDHITENDYQAVHKQLLQIDLEDNPTPKEKVDSIMAIVNESCETATEENA